MTEAPAPPKRLGRRFYLTAFLGPVLIPFISFLGVGIGSGMGGGVFGALFSQAVGRPNLLIMGVFGLFPVALLIGGLWIARKSRPGARWRRWAGWWGLAGVLATLFWVNFQFWPLYLPERVSPGFPHGLELVIGPLFFAPAAALLGAVMGGFVAGSKK